MTSEVDGCKAVDSADIAQHGGEYACVGVGAVTEHLVREEVRRGGAEEVGIGGLCGIGVEVGPRRDRRNNDRRRDDRRGGERREGGRRPFNGERRRDDRREGGNR